MYRLVIGVGRSVIQAECELGKPHILKKICQHRIILNKQIIEYYLSGIDNMRNRQFFMDLFSSIINFNDKCYLYSNNNPGDVKSEIINCTLSVPMRILVAYADEFSDCSIKGLNLITPNDIDSEDHKYLFNRYTLPIHFVVHKEDACDPYIKWLSYWFQDEEKITIVDPYVLAEKNLRFFEKTIIPIIPMGTKLVLYAAFDKTTNHQGKSYCQTAESRIQELNRDYGVDIMIKWCDYSNMHDRFIHLSECEIAISHGLVSLKKGGRFNKECRLILSRAEHRQFAFEHHRFAASAPQR